ncbi:MAG TPA: hypothetical protein VGK88_02810 [bacterium]|jgi:hypothetical protein
MEFRRCHAARRFVWPLAVFVSTVTLLASYSPAFVTGEPRPPHDLAPEKFRAFLPKLTGRTRIIVARSMGIAEMGGRRMPRATASYKYPHKRLTDMNLGADPNADGNEGTITANPLNKKYIVAGNVVFPVEVPGVGDRYRCAVYRSTDEGKHFSNAIELPTLAPETSCHHPGLTYSPDGNRAYAVYMDVKPFFSGGSDIVVSYSDDNGLSWIGPQVILDGGQLGPGTPFIFYDNPAISVPIEQGESNWVYVTATKMVTATGTADAACQIVFTRSATMGASFDPQTLLETSVSCGDLPGTPVLQGSKPAGGLAHGVLAAWYSSGADGWLAGSFEIHTRFSADNGASWGLIINAAVDAFEAPQYLGPNACYQEWWGVMFPDVMIDGDGRAHLVYTHDPVPQAAPGFVNPSPEDGDVRYVISAAAPYGIGSWAAPVTVNDDYVTKDKKGVGSPPRQERAQGNAVLATEEEGEKITLHAVWEDHRLSPPVSTEGCPDSSNLKYDIFYARIDHVEKMSKPVNPKEITWSINYRVSDISSTNAAALSISPPGLDKLAHGPDLYAIWTDRRAATSIYYEDNDTYVSRVAKKGGF